MHTPIENDSTFNWQPIYENEDVRLSGIYSKYHVNHFDQIFLPARTNLMASSMDGLLIFVAVIDTIRVYKSCDFSGKTPPLPSTVFPFQPFRTLRPTDNQILRIKQRKLIPNSGDDNDSVNDSITMLINHIRVGMIGEQEFLVAVGEHGIILVWNLARLLEDPILLESDNIESTWGIAMSRGNCLLATSSNSHTVTIFHFPSRSVIFSQNNSKSDSNAGNNENLDAPGQVLHEHNIPSLDMSLCGRWMVSCGIDGHVILWTFFLDSLSVCKYFKKVSREWGWLVRFIPHGFNYDNNNELETTSTTVTKRFYQTDLENISEELGQEELFHSDLFANTREYLERIEDLEDMPSEGEEIEYEENDFDFDQLDNQSDDHDHREVDIENITNFSELISTGFSFLNQPNNIDGVHLAEGAGDTWETEPEDEEVEYYNSQDSYDETVLFDNSSSDESLFSDSELNVDINPNDLVLTNENIPDLTADHNTIDTIKGKPLNTNLIREKITIKFPYEKVFSELESFKIFTSSSPFNADFIIPYDIFFFTSESFYAISPDDHKILYKRENFTESLLSKQNPEYFSNLISPFYDSRLKRIAMGEWIPELGLFIAIDNDGFIIIISPGSTTKLQFIIAPDTLTPGTQSVLGYTIIRKSDSEFGIKLHLYLICHDGTFRLYEIIKKR